MLEYKYASQLGNVLTRFKKSGDSAFMFRCPFCGDSKKNQLKTRGYLFSPQNGGMIYKCHNCGKSQSFSSFLKEIAPQLYREFLFETLGKSAPVKPKAAVEHPRPDNPLQKCPLVITLSDDHPARVFLAKRKIPYKELWHLRYADPFGDLIDTDDKQPRIIIPLIGEDGVCFGHLGRALNSDKSTLRYITTILDKTHPSIYGGDRVDYTRPFFITEGAFDAMFLPNAIATLSVTKRIPFNPNGIYVLDNEPRNKDVVRAYDDRISSGDKIFIWPSDVIVKDINDWVLAGIEIEAIPNIINQNTFQGLEAKLRLSQWRKCH